MPSVNKILKSAKNSSKSPRAKKAIEEIKTFDEVATPDEPNKLALGIWDPITNENQFSEQSVVVDDTPQRVQKILQKKGFQTDSPENWKKCSNCDRPIRVQKENENFIMPYMALSKNGEVCLDCIDKKELINNLLEGNSFSNKYLDLKKYNFFKMKQTFFTSQHSPIQVSDKLKQYGINNFIFNFENIDVKKEEELAEIEYSIWIHKKDLHKVPKELTNINLLPEEIKKIHEEHKKINDLSEKVINRIKKIQSKTESENQTDPKKIKIEKNKINSFKENRFFSDLK